MEGRLVTALRWKNGDSRAEIQGDHWGHTLRHTKGGAGTAGGHPGEGFGMAEGPEKIFSGLGIGTVLGTEGTSRGGVGDCRVSRGQNRTDTPGSGRDSLGTHSRANEGQWGGRSHTPV